MAWIIASAHASILEGMAEANAALARGELSAAIFLPLLMGLAYGVVHTLGPGHGKIVFGGHSFAQEARPAAVVARAFGGGALHVLSAVAIMAALGVTLGFGGMPVEAQMKPIRIAAYAIVAVVGLALLARAFLPQLALLHHRGNEAASTAGVVLGVGLVPCTGSLLVISFSLANNVLALGLAVIAAIGIGMAATLAVIGLVAGLARRAAAPRPNHPSARWPSAVGGFLLVITGLFFLHGLNP